MYCVEAEFNDPHRKELLKVLKDALPTIDVQTTAWACLWLSDIEKLEKIVSLAREEPFLATMALDAGHLQTMIPTWTQRNRPSSASQIPSSAPQQPLPARESHGQKRTSSGQPVIRNRSQKEAEKCRQRDQGKCILTHADIFDVAHIYPFSMRYKDDTTRDPTGYFWHSLRTFWCKDRIDAWHTAIFSSSTTTDVCQNLICLSPNAHRYWQKARFALKPLKLSDDNKRLDVQFFWLPSNPYTARTDFQQAPSLSTLHIGPDAVRLFNHITLMSINSGDEISLETDEPDLRPLPDLRLLEMQWFLQRVAAVSGAAECQDDFHYEDDGYDMMQAWHDHLDVEMEDDWAKEMEEVPTTEPPKKLGGGGDETDDNEEEDVEGEDGRGEVHAEKSGKGEGGIGGEEEEGGIDEAAKVLTWH